MGEMFTTQVFSDSNQKPEITEFKEGDTFDWSSGLEDADDSQLYFSPVQGGYNPPTRGG